MSSMGTTITIKRDKVREFTGLNLFISEIKASYVVFKKYTPIAFCSFCNLQAYYVKE